MKYSQCKLDENTSLCCVFWSNLFQAVASNLTSWNPVGACDVSVAVCKSLISDKRPILYELSKPDDNWPLAEGRPWWEHNIAVQHKIILFKSSEMQL